MSENARPVIILVGGRDQLTRGFCLEWLAAHYRVALIVAQPPTWQCDLIVDYEVADQIAPAAVVAAGAALAGRHSIAGVLTWDEYSVVAVAALGAELGLRTNTVVAATSCRDKATARRLLAEQRVGSAESIPVSTLDEAVAAASILGYPVVLKPTSYAASIGVIRVDAPENLTAAWKFTSGHVRHQGPEGSGALVEEYLDGPEFSVECVTISGCPTALAVTHKEVGIAPFFEELGHTVSADDPLLPKLAPVAEAAIRALGLTDGVAHVEIRCTTRGPRIVEVNPRLGGDMTAMLVRLATGLDLPRIAADVACGHTPDLTPRSLGTAAVKNIYATADGVLTARDLDMVPGPRYPWLQQVGWLREVGDRVFLPPNGDLDTARIGFFIVTADDQAQVHERIGVVTDQLTVTVTDASITTSDTIAPV